MTREQIEKRAVAIKDSQNYHMSFEDAQDYISKCGFDIPWNDGDVFVDDREITRTIGNVLKWRINSVWHDRAEKADTSKELILMYSNGLARVTLLNPNLTFDGFLSVDMFIKWAYLDDLLPERKEETDDFKPKKK